MHKLGYLIALPAAGLGLFFLARRALNESTSQKTRVFGSLGVLTVLLSLFQNMI